MWKTLRVYAHSNASTTTAKPRAFLYIKLEHTLGARHFPVQDFNVSKDSYDLFCTVCFPWHDHHSFFLFYHGFSLQAIGMVFGVQVKSSTGVTELLRAYIAEDLQNGDAIMRLDAKDFGIIRIVVVAELAVLTVLP